MKILIQLAILLAPLSLVAQTSNVVLPQDKGPDKIDVAAYPRPAAVGLQGIFHQVLQVPHHRPPDQHHDEAR